MSSKSIDIRPDVGILSVLSHLNYKPWFAIAEFVDNAIQSYLDYKDDLYEIDGQNYKLKIEIELSSIDNGTLVIRDNAAGIHENDYPRAFRPAVLPPDRNGLSEFGMGMKSAACWFSPYWSVRTSALGEAFESTVTFDINKIVNANIRELQVSTHAVPINAHYTEITLVNLHNPPQKKTITKIKDHLASIYRVFIQKNILELWYNNQLIEYTPVDILYAPSHIDESSEEKRWFKNLNFDFGQGLSAHGFVGIRAKASTSEAGFALFRRDRVIQGSADETYRPSLIFGASNSYRYQRIFGEIHLEGFDVSHTKDGFQWDENEQTFLELLREEIDREPLPLLKQAEGYRVRQKTKELKGVAEISNQRVAHAIRDNTSTIIEQQITQPPESNPPLPTLPPSTEEVSKVTIQIEVFDEKWEITLELVNDLAVGDWIRLSQYIDQGNIRLVHIRLSLAHPFMLQFTGMDSQMIEPLQRVAIAIILSEITARESGVNLAGTFTRNINQFLREAFTKP